jgi:hypothetical protein
MIPEPWHSFLKELDQAIPVEVSLHCIGGFVITQIYGLPRQTADVDVITIAPRDEQAAVLQKAGKGSELHKKYGIYLDFVTVASSPHDYIERLTEMFPGTFRRLRLFALDPYDIALTKLTRNIERDREDVKYLARTITLNLEVLKHRYQSELRPYVIGDPKQHDLTLELWIEMIQEERNSGTGYSSGT